MLSIRVKGITCIYDSSPVLKDVDFFVEAGEFVGVLGPNGSGKTTLLRSIGRALSPSSGSVLVDDVDVYSLRSLEVAKMMAVVPQESVISFQFKVSDVVLMGRNPYVTRFGWESACDLEAAEKAMRLAGCLHLADRNVTEISGGEKQRVMIARALAQETGILLLDEPTLHLDIMNQIELLDLLKKRCKEDSLTVLAVFHDFNLAARYCDSVILISGGHIASLGKVVDVFTEENLENVFSVKVKILKDLSLDSLVVIPLESSGGAKEA